MKKTEKILTWSVGGLLLVMLLVPNMGPASLLDAALEALLMLLMGIIGVTSLVSMVKKRARKRILLLMGLMAALLLTLAGCMTREEREELADFREKAIRYYTGKYGEEPEIEETRFYEISLDRPIRTDNRYCICEDGTVIYYNAQLDLMTDSRQGQQITEALEQAFDAELKELEKTMTDGRFEVRELSFSAYHGDLEGAFFHHYFDGDVEKFMEQEDIRLTGEVWLICPREDSWQQTAGIFGALVEQVYRGGEDLRLAVLDETCRGLDRYPDVHLPGCHGVWEYYDGAVEYWIQDYIPLIPGLYATSAEPNFRLEEGDVRFVPAITQEELNTLLAKRYEDLPDTAPKRTTGDLWSAAKDNTDHYGQVTAATPIYRLEFSQRAEEQLGDHIKVYLLFCPEEIGLSEEARYLTCPMDDAEAVTCYTAANKTEVGEYHVLRLDKYEFIGWQTLISPQSDE